MTSKAKRPFGVTLLAFVFLWIGCLGSVFFPIFLFSGLVAATWNQLTLAANQSGPWLRFLVHIGAYPAFLAWFLCYVAYVFIGFGLWRLRNWARRAVLGLMIFGAGVGALFTVASIRPAAFAFAMIVGIVLPLAWIIWYLKRPLVRSAFGLETSIQIGTPAPGLSRGMSRKAKISTVALLLASFALFFCALTFAVESMIRQSTIYGMTLSEAGRFPCVSSRLGSPIKPGWMVSGNIQQSSVKGTAHLEIPVRGPKGEGSLVVSGEKKNGDWQINELVLVQNKEELRLLTHSSSSTCQ